MEILLIVDVINYPQSSDDEVTTEKTITLRKEITLPFTPFIGLKLFLDGIDERHPNFDRYMDSIADHNPFVSGLFKVEGINYSIPENCFDLYCSFPYDPYMSPNQFQRLVDQLVFGFEFSSDSD